MLKRLSRVALFVGCSVVAFAALNCATVVNGTNQSVAITSSPEGALVDIRQWGAPPDTFMQSIPKAPPESWSTDTGRVAFTGVTPAECRLARSFEYNVSISLLGYETKYIHIFRTPSAALAGNVFAGGCCGAGIDMANGAGYDLKPSEIDVTLLKLP
jgi:hypothetical protein